MRLEAGVSEARPLMSRLCNCGHLQLTEASASGSNTHIPKTQLSCKELIAAPTCERSQGHTYLNVSSVYRYVRTFLSRICT